MHPDNQESRASDSFFFRHSADYITDFNGK